MSPLRRFLQIVFALAVRKKDGTLFTSLSDEMLLELGDQSIVIGNREQLRDLEGTIKDKRFIVKRWG